MSLATKIRFGGGNRIVGKGTDPTPKLLNSACRSRLGEFLNDALDTDKFEDLTPEEEAIIAEEIGKIEDEFKREIEGFISGKLGRTPSDMQLVRSR